MGRISFIVMSTTFSFSWTILEILFTVHLIPYVNTIGCFKCISTNHDNPGCEDPFVTWNMTHYVSDCWGYKMQGGSFPSTKCIKFEVIDEKNGYYLMLRDCLPEDGAVGSDNELGQVSHCSPIGTGITFNDRRSDGCIEVCFDDGCNKAYGFRQDLFTILFVCGFSSVLLY